MGYYNFVPAGNTIPENFHNEGGGGGGGGTDNYNSLSNKPKINDVELSGNRTAAQLKLVGMNGVQAYSTMPSTPTANMTVMYTGEAGLYQTGAIYRYSGGDWVLLMNAAEAASISEAEIKSLFA